MNLIHYVYSGANLFSASCVDEALEFYTEYSKMKYTIRIKRVSSFDLENLEYLSMAKGSMALTFINLLMQKILRSGTL